MAKPKNGKGKNGGASNKRSTGVDGKPADDDQPNYVSNSEARTVIIQECAQGMKAIGNERAELNERAADIRERLRDAGIDVKSFMVALKLEAMEADDRTTYLENLREHMAALHIGEQGSLFPDPAASKAKNQDFGEGVTH
jgi:hypothetical protein